MLTLRQIEVVRAIMVAGTVNGAAKLLNVSAPGVSRVMKHAEDLLGVKLFARRHGRFVPTPEVKTIIDRINEVHRNLMNLQWSVENLKRGGSSVFSFASVPSIAQFVMPRAMRRLRDRYPALVMNVDIVKIEEAIDYILLKRGELVALSYRLDHPGITSYALAEGELVALVPEGHPLAQRPTIAVAELVDYPLIGVDARDPYGRVIADAFYSHGLSFELSLKVRFAQTVISLVQQNLGVAVIDEFSVATEQIPGIVRVPFAEPTPFAAFVAVNADTPESMFAQDTIGFLREEMTLAVAHRSWRPQAPLSPAKAPKARHRAGPA